MFCLDILWVLCCSGTFGMHVWKIDKWNMRSYIQPTCLPGGSCKSGVLSTPAFLSLSPIRGQKYKHTRAELKIVPVCFQTGTRQLWQKIGKTAAAVIWQNVSSLHQSRIWNEKKNNTTHRKSLIFVKYNWFTFSALVLKRLKNNVGAIEHYVFVFS